MKNKLSRFEIVFYTLSGLLFIAGIVFVILGIIADHASPNDPLQNAQNAFFSFRYFGLILLSSGTVIAVLSLLLFARGAEKRAEREERRKQRLEMAEKIEKEEVIDVKSSTVITNTSTPNVEANISSTEETKIESQEKVEPIKEENK